MRIKVGYELVYECPQPTPMLLMLNIHLYPRIGHRGAGPSGYRSGRCRSTAYRDGFGNWCSRIVAPKGVTRISTTPWSVTAASPTLSCHRRRQHSLEELPEEALVFLLAAATARRNF